MTEALANSDLEPIAQPTSAEASCDVLHVLWPGSWGGVQTHLTGFVRQALADGEMVHRVCFLKGRGGAAEVLADVSVRLGFRSGWNPRDLWRFARVLRAMRPRVIHFHWRVLGVMVVARLVSPRTPLVYTEHHPDAVRGDARARLFYRVFARFFSRFVVTSPAMIAHVTKYGVPATAVRVIPYGLAIPVRPPDDPIEQRGNVVGVLTRIDRPKRVDLYLDVLAELRARGVPCSGLVVGDGDQRLTCEEHARRLGLGDSVEFVGARTDVERWLDRFDVFLTTSSIDTFGLAVLEAMARGVAVVGMPCPGGLPDLLGAGGVLTADRDVRTAADAVEALLTSAAERESVARRGYELATRYTLEAAVVAHSAMYREILAAGSSH